MESVSFSNPHYHKHSSMPLYLPGGHLPNTATKSLQLFRFVILSCLPIYLWNLYREEKKMSPNMT